MKAAPLCLTILALLVSCTPQPVRQSSPPLRPTASAAAPLPSLPASVPWPCAQQGDVDGDKQADNVRRERSRVAVEVQGKVHPIPLPATAVTRVCVGDLDGDDRSEVLVGVIRPTEKEQTFRERVFVYRFDGRALRPHFLGTRGGGQLLYFGVSDLTLRLALAEAILTGSLHRVASSDRAIVQRELDAIDRRAGARSELGIDYATFEVRGHYAKTEALGRFFKAHMLLSSLSVRDPREVALMTALALTDPLHRHLLSALDRLGRELVGPPASHTPIALLERARSRWGDSPRWADLDTDDVWYEPLPLLGQSGTEKVPSDSIQCRLSPTSFTFTTLPRRIEQRC